MVFPEYFLPAALTKGRPAYRKQPETMLKNQHTYSLKEKRNILIYFDHNATTPINQEVRNVFNEAMEKYWGNPSSAHILGIEASRELKNARIRLAQLLDVLPSELYFTSGGTEADNLTDFNNVCQ